MSGRWDWHGTQRNEACHAVSSTYRLMSDVLREAGCDHTPCSSSACLRRSGKIALTARLQAYTGIERPYGKVAHWFRQAARFPAMRGFDVSSGIVVSRIITSAGESTKSFESGRTTGTKMTSSTRMGRVALPMSSTSTTSSRARMACCSRLALQMFLMVNLERRLRLQCRTNDTPTLCFASASREAPLAYIATTAPHKPWWRQRAMSSMSWIRERVGSRFIVMRSSRRTLTLEFVPGGPQVAVAPRPKLTRTEARSRLTYAGHGAVRRSTFRPLGGDVAECGAVERHPLVFSSDNGGDAHGVKRTTAARKQRKLLRRRHPRCCWYDWRLTYASLKRSSGQHADSSD